jgi:GWxTD domain-containing protein
MPLPTAAARALKLAVAALLLAASARAQQPVGLNLRAVRFYRADTKQTRVRAFVQIPYALMSAAGNQATYEVRVRVSDSTGLTLYKNSWNSHAPASLLQQPGAEVMEMVDFAVAPGTYRLDVAVQDSASGRQAERGIALQGFNGTPDASDLLLSPAMRVADKSDTVPRAGEMRDGSTLITAVATLRLTPLRTKAYYLLEAYNPSPAPLDGTMAVAVLDQNGKAVIPPPSAKVSIAPGGGVLRGQLDLDGLPAGRYTMTVKVDAGAKHFERSSEFVMADLQETMARDTLRIAEEKSTDEGYFRYMSPENLDAAEAPLSLIARSGELKAWSPSLSVEAKRRFLTEFWDARDRQTPGIRQAFYDRIAYANRAFIERGRGQQPGWKSDRGRIWAKNGVPDDSLAKLPQGRAPRWTAWRYTHGRGRYYVFVDRTGVGNWVLLTTDDRFESTLPGWQDILTPDAVRELGQYVGTNFQQSDLGGPNGQ